MELLILGVLQEKEMYGYEIKKVIEHRAGDFTNYKFGSVYYALKQLTKKESIVFTESKRVDDKPERKLYSITDFGRDKFVRLLKQSLFKVKRIYYPFDEVIFFAKFLDRKVLVEALHSNLEQNKLVEKHLNDKIEKIKQNEDAVSFNADIIIMHTLVHVKAEIEWLCMAINYFEEGDF